MKRILSLILCALFFVCAAPAVSGGNEKALCVEPLSPVTLENGVVEIVSGTTASELLACFENKNDVSLTAADGAALSLADPVFSGAVVSCGEDSATVVVPGDVNGDGSINTRDVICAMRAILGVPGAVEAAADVCHDGTLNSRDIQKLMRYLVGWDEELSSAVIESAENEDEALNLYFTSTMLRVAREDTAIHGESDGLIRTAKNEIEDAHIILVSTEQKTELTLDVGEIKNEAGDVLDCEVRYGYYYSSSMFTEELLESREKQDWGMVTGGNWSEPYPALSAPFAIGANESQSFIVKVKTTADTAAGWYSAPVRVLDAKGRELKKAILRVYVWDFALDETPACRTLFGMASGWLASYYQRYEIYDASRDGPFSDIYENDWYEYALENRISSYGLPANETKYLDDPRVTAFVSDRGSNVADCWDDPAHGASVRKYYEFLSQKQEWLDKAYIYTVDEPWNSTGAAAVKKQWEGAKAALGDIPFKTILPLTSNGWMSDLGCDMFEFSLDYCNAICPQSNCWTITATTRERRADKDKYPLWAEYPDDAAFKKYGQFRPRFDALRDRGDDIWWYICVGPLPPYANWWSSQQGAVNRAVLWQQYFYDIDGILYWDIVFWQVSEKDSRRITLTRGPGGDGLLLYDGSLWDEGIVPVPSIRLEEVRDGIEDFQYLRQLERISGRDEAMKYTTRVTTDILVYAQDWHDIDGARREMGFLLESLAD